MHLFESLSLEITDVRTSAGGRHDFGHLAEELDNPVLWPTAFSAQRARHSLSGRSFLGVHAVDLQKRSSAAANDGASCHLMFEVLVERSRSAWFPPRGSDCPQVATRQLT